MKATGAFLVLLLLGANAFADDAPKKSKPKFTISKETTFVTEPVDKDGYIDYAAALNARLGKGVTPENNANVLIWKALGPRPEGGKGMPAEFFKLMGMDQPPEKGEYFVDLDKFIVERLKLDTSERSAIDEQQIRAMQRPWTAKEHPQLAAWLKANETALALVVEATKRTHYFSPLVARKSDLEPTGLMNALLSGVQKCRGLARALSCRAMLNTGEGHHDKAWEDLLACHRLGRHVGSGATLIEALVGIAIDTLACRADLAFLESAGVDAKQIQKCLIDLRALSPLPVIAEKIDLAERFLFLDCVMLTSRHGPDFMSKSGGKPDPLFREKDINWDPALRNGNRWYNRMVAAMRELDLGTREKEFGKIEDELKRLKSDHSGFEAIARLTRGGASLPDAKGEVIGNVLINLMMPATWKIQQAADRAEQTQRNLYIAFALAAYQREHGKYPEKLDALAPKYLAKVPDDYFTGKPLVYRPNEKGYLLYSFGPNGKDDGGKGREDEVGCDDISVRMPLPIPAKK